MNKYSYWLKYIFSSLAAIPNRWLGITATITTRSYITSKQQWNSHIKSTKENTKKVNFHEYKLIKAKSTPIYYDAISNIRMKMASVRMT